MSENSEREVFLSWWRASKYCQVANGHGEQTAWDAWQARAARQQVDAPTKRRVEKDPGGGWIARRKDGSIIPDESFRWNSRSAAQGAVLDSDTFDRTAQQVAAPPDEWQLHSYDGRTRTTYQDVGPAIENSKVAAPAVPMAELRRRVDGLDTDFGNINRNLAAREMKKRVLAILDELEQS